MCLADSTGHVRVCEGVDDACTGENPQIKEFRGREGGCRGAGIIIGVYQSRTVGGWRGFGHNACFKGAGFPPVSEADFLREEHSDSFHVVLG